MQDLFWQLKDVDSFTVYTTAAFAAAVFWFIREIVGAPMLAIFSVPILMTGGVVAPIVFRAQMINLSYDKEANVAATTAVGVLVALVFVVVLKWLWVLLKERKAKRTKIDPVARKAGALR